MRRIKEFKELRAAPGCGPRFCFRKEGKPDGKRLRTNFLMQKLRYYLREGRISQTLSRLFCTNVY